MLRTLSLVLMVSGALCGCVSQPMDPGEFRQAARKSSFAVVETVDVAQPYTQVADRLRRKANECLAVTINSSANVFQGNMMVTERSRSTYTPTVTVTPEATELALQVEFGNTPFTKKPKDGLYLLVADAVPVGKNATKLTIYRGTIGKGKAIGDALRAWATAERSVCPDLND